MCRQRRYMAVMNAKTQGGRVWLRTEMRLGRKAARPVILLGVMNTILAIVQGGSVASILGNALIRRAPAAWWAILLFCVAACLRAALAVASDRFATRNGATARQRLRLDAMSRLLAAGPSLLRWEHSAALATTAVDRIDALDGFFARWIPASVLAIASPILVLIAVAFVDWRGAMVLAAAGLLVPLAQAVSGIGAAAASRNQFTALSRLQARFLDRVRGIATIVLAGRAADEARALAVAADELRRRTMRVLRVAFIASAALDCAVAVALVVLALRYGHAALVHRLDPVPALFALLMVPEFFAPLRAFSVAYQDRAQAGAAAEALAALPETPVAPVAPAAIRTVSAHGVSIAFEHVGFTWDPHTHILIYM